VVEAIKPLSVSGTSMKTSTILIPCFWVK